MAANRKHRFTRDLRAIYEHAQFMRVPPYRVICESNKCVKRKLGKNAIQMARNQTLLTLSVLEDDSGEFIWEKLRSKSMANNEKTAIYEELS